MTQEVSIARNIARVRERIARAAERAGRHAGEITLVGVSKTFPAEAIRTAHEAGLRIFAENRVQEFEAKQPQLADLDATWHFIGRLQSNKARRAAHLFDRVDCVDTLGLAQKLDSASAEEQKRLAVLIEVHVGGESSKGGVTETDLPGFAEGVAALPHLEFRGLMAIPPYFDDPEQARSHFRRLRELHEETVRRIGRPLPVLSMGMSHDFEVAIAEGATEIRVGTAIFGERQAKP